MGSASSTVRLSFDTQLSSSSHRGQSSPSKGDRLNKKYVDVEGITMPNWLHPPNGGCTTSSIVQALDGHQGVSSQVEHAPVTALNSSDWNSGHSGAFESPAAAVVSAMVGLLDMLEASVRAGRSKLPLDVVPFLGKCRGLITSCRDNIRHCASALHSLGAQLQSSSKATSEDAFARVPEVELIYQLVLRIRQGAPGAEMEVAESLLGLAQMYRSQGRSNEAIKYFQRLARVISCTLGHGHPSLSAALNFLAESQVHANRFSEAEFTCRRAILIADASLGVNHPHTQGYRRNLDAVQVMKARYESHASGLVEHARWRSAVSALVVNVAAPA